MSKLADDYSVVEGSGFFPLVFLVLVVLHCILLKSSTSFYQMKRKLSFYGLGLGFFSDEVLW